MFLLLSVLSLTFVFAAGQKEEAKTEEVVRIKWWNHMPPDGAQGRAFRVYIEEFEREYPNIKVEVESIPHRDYIKKLPTAIAAGEAPDLFGMTYRLLYEYHVNGAMSPVDEVAFREFGVSTIEEWKEQWAPGTLDAYMVDGNYYGLPWQFNIYSYLINTQHFREAGLDPEKDAPKFWDDVYRVGKKLVKKDASGRITRQALSFPFVHSAAWYMLELEPIIRELDGAILNEDQTECLINSETGIKAMEEIKRRFDEGISDKDIAATLDYYNTGFPTGKISMIVGGQWGPPRYYINFPDVERGTFKAIPYPTYPGKDPAISTTSWAWVVYSQSPHKAEAWRFANYITSFPSRNLLLTGDTIPRAGWSETEGAKTIPQSEFWEEMLQYAKPLANFKKYSEVSEPLKRAMQEILLTGKDIKTTLDRVKKEIDIALQE